MGKVFFIADTHFGHDFILKEMKRPFDSLEHMDKAIIERWNKVVSPQDDIWILGDYSLRDFFATRRITEALNGSKTLLRGNHDTRDDDFYLKSGIKKIYDMPVLFSGKYLLSHEPVAICENTGFVNLYGHVHTNAGYADFTKNSFCLSCERIDYTPVSFDDIIKKVESL
ncbi:MAG: metallophosphoesterase [Christensenellales bacterium]|jgi:calcineurin-like phosphoesterase family protein